MLILWSDDVQLKISYRVTDFDVSHYGVLNERPLKIRLFLNLALLDCFYFYTLPITQSQIIAGLFFF